jgi:adenylate kinase
MNLIMLGAPGSGKGTQAVRLAERADLTHLSTGDLLRAAVKNKTELGQKAEGYMQKGELVPDDIIIGLIEEKIASGELDNGFILDGFPRTIPQAEALDDMLKRSDKRIDNVVLLDVDDEEIVRRLSGRLHCSKCGAGYHALFNKPKNDMTCDKCGGEVTRRPDDDEEVVRNRLDVYKKQTQPIEDYYRNKSLLVEITGIGTPDEIFDRIVDALGVAASGD